MSKFERSLLHRFQLPRNNLAITAPGTFKRSMISDTDPVKGSAYAPQVADNKLAGDIYIDGQSVILESDGKQVILPLEGLTIKLGGAADRLVFFTHAQDPDISIHTADPSILTNTFFQSDPRLLQQIQGLKKKRWLGRGFVLAVCAIILLCFLGLYALKGPLAGYLASVIPVSMEETVGETAWAQHSGGQHIIDTPEVTAQLETLTTPLVEAIASDRYEFQFYIIEDESINAFALPGGIIALHSGLILQADRPEEVLGVIAHEIAHVTLQHSMRNIIESAGLFVIVQSLFGDMSGLAAVLADSSTFLLRQKFSRDFEREADAQGMHYLIEANIDPRGMVELFTKLKAVEEEMINDAASEALSWVSTHPTSDERIEDLNNAIDLLPHTVYPDFVFSFDAFKATIRNQLSTE